MIHGSAASTSRVTVGRHRGRGRRVSVVASGEGVGVGVAVGVGVGVGVGGGVTVNANSPEIGWPSLETTFHSTVMAPDAAPASGWVSTLSCTVGAPAARVVPAASVTCTSVAPSSVAMSALKVSVSWAGSASSGRVGGGIGRDQLVVRARRGGDEQAAGGQERRGEPRRRETDEGTRGESLCRHPTRLRPSPCRVPSVACVTGV